MPVKLSVTQFRYGGVPMLGTPVTVTEETTEVTAMTPKLSDIKKAIGPLSMLLTEKTLRGFCGSQPFDLYDGQGRLAFRVIVKEFGL